MSTIVFMNEKLYLTNYPWISIMIVLNIKYDCFVDWGCKMDELEELRRKKLEQLKERFLKGEEKMGDNWPNEPIEINDGNLGEVVNRYDTVAVDCWAEWCAPCHMIAPILKELATEMQGKLVFGKLNVDENRASAAQFGIMSIPSLLVFKSGELVDKIVGAMPKGMLMAKLNPYL